jgi:hypothetical protein
MKISIDPAVQMTVGGLAVISGVLVGCAGQFTTIFGAGESAKIVAACSVVATVAGGLITFLGAATSSQPGPLAPPDSPRVAAATIEDKKDDLNKQAAALTVTKP